MFNPQDRFKLLFKGLLIGDNLPGPYNANTKSNQCNKLMAVPRPNPTLWPEKKFGYVPFANKHQAKCPNEEVLPSFYECQRKFSRNARIFQNNFHTEGRRQYDHHTKLKNIQQSFNLWTKKFPEDNPLKPTDRKRMNVMELCSLKML